MNFLDDLKEKVVKILVYMAVEEIDDYTENTKTLKFLNPRPIRAIVTQLSDSKAYWSTKGVADTTSYALLIDKKNENLIRESQMIKIPSENNAECYGFKQKNKIQFKKYGDKNIEVLTWMSK